MATDTRSTPLLPQRTDLRLLPIFSGIFSACLVIAAVGSSKLLTIGPFTIPGGTLVFPITFILNDILTEVYGFSRSRRVIWTALASNMIAAVALWVIEALPPASFWPHQAAFEAVLGFAPRVAIAGLIAFFCGEFANSFVISKMKYWEKGERGLKQGWRFVASTIVGEAVDSAVFMTLAFVGTIPPANLFETMLTLYVVKVAYEIVALPLSTRVANWVKDLENVDHIDYPERTAYNPFVILADDPVETKQAGSVGKT